MSEFNRDRGSMSGFQRDRGSTSGFERDRGSMSGFERDRGSTGGFEREVDVLLNHVSVADKRVIDVGSGAGGLVRWLRKQGAHPVGVECGPVMREMAAKADPDHPEAYVDGVGQDLPFDDASADVVVMFRSLHHIPRADMVPALAEAHRVLRSGGHLFVLEPVATGPGHDVMVLVDDETTVRAHAQEALGSAEQIGFTTVVEGAFVAQSVYPDFDAFESHVVGIDPTRAANMARHRAATHERFHELAERTEAGYTFPNPHVYRVLAKASPA